MQDLTAEEILHVSGGLSDSQMSYLITSAFQSLIGIGYKWLTTDSSSRSFVLNNVGGALMNIFALGIGSELANYYIEYRHKNRPVAKKESTA